VALILPSADHSDAASCSPVTFTKGKVDTSAPIRISGKPIRTLEEGDNETYLGVPIGSRLLFRHASSTPDSLVKVADSDRAPWQILEVFCSHLLPSISHRLATGCVEKSFLHDLEKNCADFLRLVSNVPHNVHSDFLYADRRVGGLGASRLFENADVWTIARAAQLLDSRDSTVRLVARVQNSINISNALKIEPFTALLSDYLYGSQTGGLYDIMLPAQEPTPGQGRDVPQIDSG
jgi:hypothetical protein